jgi:hypothetical protein
VHGDVDRVALAVALAAEERGQNADDRRHRAAADIGDEHARQLAGLLEVRPIGRKHP